MAWWLRRRFVAVAVAGAIIAAGVAVMVTRDGSGVDMRPFEEAVDNLALAEGMTYRSTVAGVDVEMTVTRQGDALGSMNLAGIDVQLLIVDGTTYFKAPDILPPGLGPEGTEGTGPLLSDRWITGGQGLAASLVPQQSMTPEALAQRLRDTLGDPERLSVPDDLVSEIEGQAVRGVRGPDLDLYVTEATPHQVVRVTSGGPSVPELPSLPSLPEPPSIPEMPSLPSLPELPEIPTTAGLQGPAAGRAGQPTTLPELPELPEVPEGLGGLDMDVTPAAPGDPEAIDDLMSTYDDIAEATEQLGDAVDASVTFDVQGSATLACGGACTVTANVTNTLAGRPGTEVVESQVTAEMTATITVEGAAAGSCTSPPTPLPANGSGSLSCSSAPAGTQFAAARARKQAAARPGTPVTVVAAAQASVVARAAVSARVEQMLDDLGQRRRESLGNMCGRRVVGASTSVSGSVCQNYVPLSDVVPAADRRRFERQSQSTYAGVYVGGRRIGRMHRSAGDDRHAEQRLADSGDWEDALAAASAQGATLDLVLNRTPCATTCQNLVEELARQAQARGVTLRIIATGAYTGGNTPDAASTTGWVTRTTRRGASIVVGVPRSGMRPGGTQLAEALDSINPPPG